MTESFVTQRFWDLWWDISYNTPQDEKIVMNCQKVIFKIRDSPCKCLHTLVKQHLHTHTHTLLQQMNTNKTKIKSLIHI